MPEESPSSVGREFGACLWINCCGNSQTSWRRIVTNPKPRGPGLGARCGLSHLAGIPVRLEGLRHKRACPPPSWSPGSWLQIPPPPTSTPPEPVLAGVLGKQTWSRLELLSMPPAPSAQMCSQPHDLTWVPSCPAVGNSKGPSSCGPGKGGSERGPG